MQFPELINTQVFAQLPIEIRGAIITTQVIKGLNNAITSTSFIPKARLVDPVG